MAGSPDLVDRVVHPLVQEVMSMFKIKCKCGVEVHVDEKTAREIVGYSSIIASETVAKWKRNQRKTLRAHFDMLYCLIEKAKDGDATALDEAEKLALTLYVKPDWEI